MAEGIENADCAPDFEKAGGLVPAIAQDDIPSYVADILDPYTNKGSHFNSKNPNIEQPTGRDLKSNPENRRHMILGAAG